MHKGKKRPIYRKIVLRLTDLDHAKSSVLNSLSSPHSRRNYKFAMEQFITWYCSEPRLALNRTVVLRFRLYLESLGLAAGTINQRMAAVRRLAYEAADSGLLSPELAAGIRRVKGAKQLGSRAGNWLNRDQAELLLANADGEDLRSLRDVAMISILLGCGLRRAELASLQKDDIQIRQGHWAIVDLVGKGNHVRTVPMPGWAKTVVDRWLTAAKIVDGRIFRAVSRHGTSWGEGISENVIWYVVRNCAERIELDHLAPHDLRRTCAKLCHVSGGELEQIQFLLGHASVLTTERYLGCKQNLEKPVNDRFGCLFSRELDLR
jgi:site-specific recombinase XerD